MTKDSHALLEHCLRRLHCRAAQGWLPKPLLINYHLDRGSPGLPGLASFLLQVLANLLSPLQPGLPGAGRQASGQLQAGEHTDQGQACTTLTFPSPNRWFRGLTPGLGVSLGLWQEYGMAVQLASYMPLNSLGFSFYFYKTRKSKAFQIVSCEIPFTKETFQGVP